AASRPPPIILDEQATEISRTPSGRTAQLSRGGRADSRKPLSNRLSRPPSAAATGSAGILECNLFPSLFPSMSALPSRLPGLAQQAQAAADRAPQRGGQGQHHRQRRAGAHRGRGRARRRRQAGHAKADAAPGHRTGLARGLGGGHHTGTRMVRSLWWRTPSSRTASATPSPLLSTVVTATAL